MIIGGVRWLLGEWSLGEHLWGGHLESEAALPSTAHPLKDALIQLEELTSTWPKEPSLYISKGKVRK